MSRILLLILLVLSTLSVSGQKEADIGMTLKWTSLINRGELVPAIVLGETYVKQIETKWGKANFTYVGSLMLLAKLYVRVNQYKKAKECCEDVIRLSTVFENNRMLRASALNTVGNISLELGDYWKAQTYLEESLSITATTFGVESSNYTTGLFNLAGCYERMGYLDRAEQQYQEVMKRWQKNSGKDNLIYAKLLTSIAILYDKVGQLNLVEPPIREALAIYKNKLTKNYSAFDEDSVAYAMTLDNLGGYYFATEQFKKAEALYNQAFQILKKVAAKNHPDYTTPLNHLAMVYVKTNQYAPADSIYQENLKIMSSSIGKDNLGYAAFINNLADLYSRQKKYGPADSLFRYALQIKEKVVGQQHTSVATSLNNLGVMYTRTKRYHEADSVLRKAINIDKKAVGEKHPSYIASLHNLSQLHVLAQNWLLADSLLQRNLQAQLEQSKSYGQFLSEYENTQAQKSFAQLFDFLATFYTQHTDLFAHSPALLLNTALYLKGNVLQNMDLLRHRVTASSDTLLVGLFAEWQTQKRALVQQIQNPEKSLFLNATTDDIRERVEQLEKKLTRQSQNFRLQEESQQIQWTQVKEKLRPNQAAIEFVRYTRYAGIRRTDSTVYIAFITRPGYAQPRLVKLCNEKQLDAILKPIGNTRRPVGQLYTSRGSVVMNGKKNTYGQKLYQLLWAPLTPYLTGVKEVFYAPDGNLHQLAFAAIPVPGGTLLSDTYKLYQRFSTRSLVHEQSGTLPQPDWNAVVYGGAIFKVDSVAWTMAVRQATLGSVEKTASVGPRSGSLRRGGSLTYLPGTLVEASAIHNLLVRQRISSQLLTRWSANEESFETFEQPPSPHILHIATHGFFFPPPKRSQVEGTGKLPSDMTFYQNSENPLLRSGLLLAGAEQVWKGGKPVQQVKDGILTAYEIAQLNLDRTELVVLSACETGLGDVLNSEGVYGLQRAFKLAGAKRLIMSLWKVPDKETTEFMIQFYQAWTTGTEVEDAFLYARKAMCRRYKSEPVKWAGFVLVE